MVGSSRWSWDALDPNDLRAQYERALDPYWDTSAFERSLAQDAWSARRFVPDARNLTWREAEKIADENDDQTARRDDVG